MPNYTHNASCFANVFGLFHEFRYFGRDCFLRHSVLSVTQVYYNVMHARKIWAARRKSRRLERQLA